MYQQTSLNAYLEVKESLNLRQKEIISVFNRFNRDFTNTELSEVLGWSINRVTPRVLELRHKGILVENKERPDYFTGRTCKSWCLSNYKRQGG